jgi:hypothetical protein
MKNRVKEVYLMLGHVLNNPAVFGLGERMPRPLVDALGQMQHELLGELREEASDRDTLSAELAQDGDNYAFPALTSVSFAIREE